MQLRLHLLCAALGGSVVSLCLLLCLDLYVSVSDLATCPGQQPLTRIMLVMKSSCVEL